MSWLKHKNAVTHLWGIFSLVVGCVVSVLLYWFGFRDSLSSQMQKIQEDLQQIKSEIRHNERLLSRDEAHVVVEYYLDALQADLMLAGHNYLHSFSAEDRKQETTADIQGFVERTTMEKTRKHRIHLGRLLLNADTRLDSFLDTHSSVTRGEIIPETMQDVVRVFESAFQGQVSDAEALKKVDQHIQRATDRTRNLLKAELDRLP